MMPDRRHWFVTFHDNHPYWFIGSAVLAALDLVLVVVGLITLLTCCPGAW